MGYSKYETSGNKNILVAWNADEKSSDGIKFERGLRFRLGYSVDYGAKENSDGTLLSYQNVEYLLNYKYKTFKGKVTCGDEGYDGNYINHDNLQNAIIKVFGDNKLLYTSPLITKGTKTTVFEIDVSNYKNLRIYASIPNVYKYDNSSSIGIVEACLEKK